MLFNMDVPNHIRLKYPKTFETMLFDSIDEYDQKMPFYGLKMKAKFIDLWTHIVRELYHNNFGVEWDQSQVARDLLDYINQNWRQEMSLDIM